MRVRIFSKKGGFLRLGTDCRVSGCLGRLFWRICSAFRMVMLLTSTLSTATRFCAAQIMLNARLCSVRLPGGSVMAL